MQEKDVKITFCTDQKLLQQIQQLQKDTNTFSRSSMIRRLVEEGLKVVGKQAI